jgi:AAA domain
MPGAAMTVEELLNRAGIHLDSYAMGDHASICPRCSATRKTHHQTLKCLGVKIDDRGVTWHCNHCEWSGPEKGTGQGNGHNHSFAAIYDYHDKDGVLRFQKVRNPIGAKNRFFMRRPNGRGGWINDTKGSDTDILYRLPDVIEAIALDRTILVVEGEKDVDNLWRIDIPATCNAHGASQTDKAPKWKAAHSEQLRGAEIVVIPDHDDPGYAHSDATCRLSLGIVKRVRRLDLAKHWPECPTGGDISDWLAAGGTRERLDALIAQAPDYTTNEQPLSPNDGRAFGYSWHLRWHGETDPITERKWLVDGLLPETGVALISGQWGTYKTFVANDLSAAVMTDTMFIKMQVKRKGGVLFLACEGQIEVIIRLTAAFKEHGGTGNAPFVWVNGCPRLLDPNASKILTAIVKHAAVKMMQQFGLPTREGRP